MGFPRRQFLQLSAAALAVSSVPRTVLAQIGDFPRKPVVLVVPQPPGGDADAVCRLLTAKMAEVLGQPVIIDNRAGAAGSIGAAYGAKAAADGYTITFVNQGMMVFNPTLYPKLGYAVEDFTPVSLLSATDLVLCASKQSGIETLQQLIERAREKPGLVSYGSAGNGSANHIATKALEMAAGIELTHVPYRGGAPAIVDALAGQIDAVMAFPMGALPHIRAGKLTPLATTGAIRSKGLPDVPTVAEFGLTDYAFSSWFGLVAPKGTPDAIVQAIHQAASAALQVPTTITTLQASLTEPVGGDAKALAAIIAQESVLWPPRIKQWSIGID